MFCVKKNGNGEYGKERDMACCPSFLSRRSLWASSVVSTTSTATASAFGCWPRLYHAVYDAKDEESGCHHETCGTHDAGIRIATSPGKSTCVRIDQHTCVQDGTEDGVLHFVPPFELDFGGGARVACGTIDQT